MPPTCRPRPRGSHPQCPGAREPASSAPVLGSQVDVPDHLPARADPDQLAQVLANLLSNAARYTPAGGRVTVRAERRPADLLVSVVNTGEGSRPTTSTGLRALLPGREVARSGARRRRIGLAIVKQLVEGAGGRVGAESAEGATRFWFSLPA